MELVARRLAQIEYAVERNPSRPDFTGLDLLSDGAISTSGSARVPRFNQWLADRQKERSQVLKQRR
eukprot:5115025-Amphidinium_carterae.1